MSHKDWTSTESTAKAWSPDKVLAEKINYIPAEVVEAVNELLAAKFSGNSAVIHQDDIHQLARKKMRENGNPDVKQDFYDKGWMDFEPIFEAEGWKIVYDKPGYNESYSANFTFSRRK